MEIGKINFSSIITKELVGGGMAGLGLSALNSLTANPPTNSAVSNLNPSKEQAPSVGTEARTPVAQATTANWETSLMGLLEKAMDTLIGIFETFISGMLDQAKQALDAGGAKGSADTVNASGTDTKADAKSSEEFLWKPKSENNKKLVVLLPAKVSQSAESVGIYKDGQLIESVSKHTFGNGNRAHFRFSKAGDSYPDNSTVIAKMKDGSTLEYPIGDSAKRNSIKK